MKPILHGIEELSDRFIKTKIPSQKINLEGLIQTFEANLDKKATPEWLDYFEQIKPLYRGLFTYGELPEEMLQATSYEILEMAEECIEGNLVDLMKKPYLSSGRSFYYEYCRSFGVEDQGSKLKEYLDQDCDFI